MRGAELDPTYEFDHDVVVVGGGPAGSSAGVFCAREGLDTVIYDRGRASIQRCAHLENYLGFPAGIDIDTLYDLMHEQVENAGCDIVPDLVEDVERTADGAGFQVTPQEGEAVTTRRVLAATRYDGEYMRGLDDEEEMFETHDHDGETHEHFADDYADHDGTTPVERLYVATPSDEDLQAIIAAGRGARVAQRVIADTREERGWWESVADGVDWVRREAELDEEWTDRQEWVEWFDGRYGEDAPVASDTAHYERVREAFIDDVLSSYIEPEAIDGRAVEGQEALATHLDEDRLLGAVDSDTMLDHIDDDQILAAAEEIESERQPAGGSD